MKNPPRVKMEPKLREGVWVGVEARSNGYKVIGEEGWLLSGRCGDAHLERDGVPRRC